MQEKIPQTDNFSYRLKMAISSSGLKQKELARRVGISEISISRYCAGTQVPSKDTLAAMAAELGRPVSWFYGEDSPLLTPLPPEPEELSDTPDWQQLAQDWKKRADAAEKKLIHIENILKELFAFAKIGL